MANITVLSVRQRQVSALVAQGLSNKEVGARLGLTPSTVRQYQTAFILPRLGLSSRFELIRWWILNVERPWEQCP